MAKFQNTRTGRLVDISDQAQTRTDRPGREKQWAGNLAAYGRSNRWRRLDVESQRQGEGEGQRQGEGEGEGEGEQATSKPAKKTARKSA